MIICVPPKSLTITQKQVLQKNGSIVLETDEPEKVRVINPEMPVDTNDFFMSALQAIADDSNEYVAKRFVKSLYKRLSEKQKELQTDNQKEEIKIDFKNLLP